MKRPLWEPDVERKRNSNMTKFMDFVHKRYGQNFDSYDKLYGWSINNIPDFWACMWDFSEIKASEGYQVVVDDAGKMPGAKWFVGARLNFAENLLRCKDNHAAFIFKGETHKSSRMTYAELYDSVALLANSLREMGVTPGDRVVAYMPNMMETAIAMLATTAVGGTWASCATDMGPGATLNRLGQIEPKVLFACNGYFHKGKFFDCLPNVAKVVKGIPSIEKVVVVSHTQENSDISFIRNAVHYDDFLSTKRGLEIQFEQLPFDHPLYIMFSSGTTGRSKCIVQGAGGILINHLKELMLHTDLKREDTIMYMTTCSWMMWNWLISSLALKATIVLYDGNPFYPDSGAMWKLIQDERITIFGTSATYINYLKRLGLKPGKDYDLSSLREICQTGSPLSADGFEYIYREIKKDLHFNSISGGTDINGCFAAGNPISPVYAGELQGPALGMKVKAYDEKGNSIADRRGELVCEAPAPSMPLYFWDDFNGEKYKQAYFNVYPDVWRHGDYVMVHSDTGGITFLGRSDSVLKPSGVRIGTAEIYDCTEKFEEVTDSLAIGQSWQEDQRIILFVKLAAGCCLTEDLKSRIKKILGGDVSPRHVPAKIIQVPDIPYTLNMKKVESVVTNIIHGRPVLNRDTLINPESLDYYEDLEELQS